ncbi:hypothetical protein [Streptomyces sp. Tu 3180]|uniref:hypothetical protein n=1 Tax=Streptomyces sp. Tu 3180 TaxID=2682611 RepID=UPI0013597DB4|nr:hypothetical protein [Streptomyces sp. Tu 3180]KAF3465213.1 hypothetical protein GL259_13275 [Streptomyces sp. Tu 3180]
MTPTRLSRGGRTPEPGAQAEGGTQGPSREADGRPRTHDPADGPAAGNGARDTTAPDGTDRPDDEGGPDDGDGEPGAGTRRARDGRLRRIVLAGTAAVLVLGGCGFLHGAHRLNSAPSAENRALTDTGATARVAGEVGNALARIFSSTPDGTAAAERSARTVLDGRAARQYGVLLDRVRDDLTEQRVTLSTRAVRTGVIELDGGRARLLVFLDQTSRRGTDEATTAPAQLTVTARLEDDRWRIVDITAR